MIFLRDAAEPSEARATWAHMTGYQFLKISKKLTGSDASQCQIGIKADFALNPSVSHAFFMFLPSE